MLGLGTPPPQGCPALGRAALWKADGGFKGMLKRFSARFRKRVRGPVLLYRPRTCFENATSPLLESQCAALDVRTPLHDSNVPQTPEGFGSLPREALAAISCWL
eukprot:46894-Chlamydomonas_euryale.AAC.1